MIDSCAEETVNGTVTLQNYATEIRAGNLTKLPPISSNHRFARQGIKFGTLYSVQIPVPTGKKWVKVRADVIPGDHPFLIGYPALKKMRANIDLDQFMLVTNLCTFLLLTMEGFQF